MLDSPPNQAAGLLRLARSQGPRLMAMVSHGDERTELPLLWRLCASLVDYGYAVTVLDATTCESDGNPGLEQLLEFGYWRSGESPEIPAWNVIPSGIGMQSLCAMAERRTQSLQHLGRLFQHDCAIILYSKAELLVPLLSDSKLKPLLAVAPVKTSLLTSYRALKHLLLKGRLEPLIVSLDSADSAMRAHAGTAAANLSECARNFLGFEVNTLNIATPVDDNPICVVVQNLALRMFESAIPLDNGILEAQRPGQHYATGNFVGSH